MFTMYDYYVIVSWLFIKGTNLNLKILSLRSYELADSMIEMLKDICNKMLLHFLELWGS